MKRIITIIFIVFAAVHSYAQENETVMLDENYLEDQIYFSFNYGILTNKPTDFLQKGFSGGLSLGFIKDIPINSNRNFGFGLGLGYGFSTYIQNLKITSFNGVESFSLAENYRTNKLNVNFIEMPFEIRWRTSTVEKYKFWRVYSGIKLSYLLSSKSKYESDLETIEIKNLNSISKFKYGLTLSVGYSTWNINIYYSLSPLFKDSILNGSEIDINEFKVGLIFYIM